MLCIFNHSWAERVSTCLVMSDFRDIGPYLLNNCERWCIFVDRSSRLIYQSCIYDRFEHENHLVLINAAAGCQRILHRKSFKYLNIPRSETSSLRFTTPSSGLRQRGGGVFGLNHTSEIKVYLKSVIAA